MLRAGLPGRLHLRGDRPDPRLVLHADGDRHAGLRPVVVRERALPGPHPGRGRPQDVQAPGQHPRADPADGRSTAPTRCAGSWPPRGSPVGGPPGRARHHPGDRPQGAADLLEHGGLPRALRPHRRAGRPAAEAPGASPSGRCWTAGCSRRPHRLVRRGHRGAWSTSTPSAPAACSRRSSTTCRTGTSAARGAASGTATRRRSPPCTSTLVTVTRLMAPLTPFITERVWQDLVAPARRERPESVHLASWPVDDEGAGRRGAVGARCAWPAGSSSSAGRPAPTRR